MSIEIIEADIDILLPTAAICMTFSQPFLELEQPFTEPFKLRAETTESLLAIDRAFDLLKDKTEPQFLLLPEYSICGTDGVRRIIERVGDDAWPCSSTVIGGLHGLTCKEYTELIQVDGITLHVSDANAPGKLNQLEWVNITAVFVKTQTGTIEVWLQPKLHPNSDEANTQHQSMFRGNSVYLFRGQFEDGLPCRFFVMTCFDWIARENGGPQLIDVLLNELNERWQENPATLNWVFVPQYNRKPNHSTFLTSAHEVLVNQPKYPAVQRRDCAVVMVCSAASPQPARNGSFGFSSIIFGPTAPFICSTPRHSYSTNTERLRSSDVLKPCKDLVFREMGACLQSCDIRLPQSVVPDTTDRTGPVSGHAFVFPFDKDSSDPRLPSAPVPPVTKWVNDELDLIERLSSTHFVDHAIQNVIESVESECISACRKTPSSEMAWKVSTSSAGRLQRHAKTAPPHPADDVEDWASTETEGLRHIVETITLLSAGTELSTDGTRLHAWHATTGTEVVAIRATTHIQCSKVINTVLSRTHSSVLMVSRDDQNTDILPRELESFLDPRPDPGLRAIDFQSLLKKARHSTTVAEFSDCVEELFDAGERTFI